MKRAIVLGAGLLLALATGARAEQKVALAGAAATVDRVKVYSTEARVYREAWVALGGGGKEARLTLASLPDAVVPGSLRVESKTAEVVRVETERRRGKLPRQAEAEALLKKIEAEADRGRLLARERGVLEQELRFLRELRLDTSAPRPGPGGKGPEEGIFVDVWARILSWVDVRQKELRARLAQIREERRAVATRLHALQVEAQQYQLGAVQRPVTWVEAVVKARPGKHRITLSYAVSGARWIPSYDLRYLPNEQSVEAVYYALVRQSSGEDWDKAKLRFSTALPTRLLAIPELPTWTLGRKRDFEPVPAKRRERKPVRWSPPPTPDGVNPVLQRLSAVSEAASSSSKDADEDTFELDSLVSGDLGKRDTGAPPPPPKPKPMPRPSRPTMAPSDDGGAPEMANESVAVMAEEAMEPPPAPGAARLSSLRSYKKSGRTRSLSVSSGSVAGLSRPPAEQLPWTDAGYRPPILSPDLPAAASEGYRYTLYAPGRHDVPASGQDRRVPLLRQRFAVKPFYRVVPGVSPYAYLLAEVKNDTGRPVLRGRAHLFTGAMYAGSSWLNTALPGRTIDLPLGVDDAVKVERQLDQKTVVKGVVFQDDVTEYTVRVQVANNHRYPITVELVDQVPLERGDKVTVEGFRGDAGVSKPDGDGRVRWRGTVPASSVKKVWFSFRIKRPKDWELRQYND